MKTGIIRDLWLVSASVLGVFFCVSCSRSVAHQRPYDWDKFPLPELSFTNATVLEVVEAVNAAAKIASHGSITQAVTLDTTPATITAYTSDASLKVDMDQFIDDYRADETNWFKRGAAGFETYPYSGHFMARHSLGCSFRELAEWTGLRYEEKPGALHLGREPAQLECRTYGIGSGIEQIAEERKRENKVHVGTEPVISAFIEVTGVGLWSIQVPTGEHSSMNDFRYDKVFRYFPDRSVLFVIDTPEAHEAAAKALKERGLWEEK